MKQIKKPVLIFMIIGAAGFIWFFIYSLKMRQQTLKTSLQVDHTHAIIQQLETGLTAVTALESGVRGFLATGDEAYIPKACDDPAQLYASFGRVSDLLKNDPFLQQRAHSLQGLVKEKVQLSCRLLLLRKQSHGEAYTLLKVRSDAAVMDTIRSISSAVLLEMNKRLQADVAANDRYQGNFYQTSLLIGVLAFLAWITGLLRINHGIRRHEYTERDLRESEISYRRLIQGAHVVMYTCNRGGFFTFISEQAAALTGYRDTELIGMHYSINLSPETFEELKEFYLKQMWEQIPVTYTEFPIITKTGENKWVEQEATLIYKNGEVRGYQCVVKDITEKKRMAMELEQTQYRLQSILDFSPSIIFIKDLQGRYLLVNKRFEEMMHIRKEQVLGKTDAELGASPKSAQYIQADLEVIENRNPITGVEILLRDGKEYHYHFTKFPLLDKHQQVYGICGMGIDITDRARYEHELITARTAAEDARRSQEIFLANMSHEIRTPMNGIIGMTNLLQNAQLGPEQREFINTIKQSAANLLVVVNEILDFSKIRSGKMILERIGFSLHEVLENALFPLQHQAREKDLSFYMEIDEAVPDQLLGDPVRLSQVLVNLVENAIKFTPEGSVTLLLKFLEADNNRVLLYFEVSDTGIGIPTDKQEMVFESFTQTNADNTRRFGGTGLGLAICKELIALQGGGLLNVRSEEGVGTIFSFELPFTKNLFSQEKAPDEATVVTPQAQVLTDISLLVVEDNEINRKVVFHTLRKAGALVDIAFNGMEAIRYLERRPYDCIIMDIQMPEMDGYQATARIREKDFAVPVIAMTASAIKGEREKCLQAGMNDYISKPFEPEELFKKILQHTGKQIPVRFSEISIPMPEQPAGAPKGLVDFEHLRALLFNDTAYIQEMLQEFLDTMPETARELLLAAQQQQWDRVFFLSHRLKSSLGIVRISNAMELAKALEKDAQLHHNIHTIPERVQQLTTLLLNACKEVEMEIERL